MKSYRRRPVLVEAVQLDKNNSFEVARWCGGRSMKNYHPSDKTLWTVGLVVPTLKGALQADEGDYIVKSHLGDFFISNPESFAENFEEIDD